MRALLGIVLASLALPSLAAAGAGTTSVSVTTDASGDATSYTSEFNGRIVYVWYQDGFDDTADLTITCEDTAEGIWTESNVTAAQVVAPTKLVQDQVGTDTTQRDYIWCINDRIKIVVAQGGNAKTAVFVVTWF